MVEGGLSGLRVSQFTWWAGLIILAVLAATAVLVQREFARGTELRRAADHSYTTRAALQRVLSLHHDLETGQWGFIITGDESFLEPYQDARAWSCPDVAVHGLFATSCPVNS
jgi:CHASE3 domain sensor protein